MKKSLILILILGVAGAAFVTYRHHHYVKALPNFSRASDPYQPTIAFQHPTTPVMTPMNPSSPPPNQMQSPDVERTMQTLQQINHINQLNQEQRKKSPPPHP